MSRLISWALGTALTLTSGVALALTPKTNSAVTDTSITLTHSADNDGATALLGELDCVDSVGESIQVTFTTIIGASSETNEARIELFSVARDSTTAIDCTTDSICAELDSDDVSFGATSTVVTIDFNDLTGLTETSACEAAIDQEFFVRLSYLTDPSTSATTRTVVDARVIVDTEAPDAPTLSSVTLTDQTMQLEWEDSDADDVDHYLAIISTQAFDGDATFDEIAAGDGFVAKKTLADDSGDSNADESSVELDAETIYHVAVFAVDEAENKSRSSGSSEHQARQSLDFWGGYVEAGGEDPGGHACQAAPNDRPWPLPFAWLFAASALLMLARHRKRRARRAPLALSALIITIAAPGVAFGQDEEQTSRFSAEVKLGGYTPSIDSEFSEGQGPYQRFFGDKGMWMFETQLSVAAIDLWGPLGVTANIGYAQKSASMLFADDGTDAPGETTLRIIPMRLGLSYNAEYLYRRFHVPLIPSATIGLDYALWSTKDAGDDTSGSGGKSGWHVGAGLDLVLDPLAPGSAAVMSRKYGIEKTYLGVDFTSTHLNNFGQSTFDLSDNQWLFGLGFSF